MNIHDATEQAYKNGYDAGVREISAETKILKQELNSHYEMYQKSMFEYEQLQKKYDDLQKEIEFYRGQIEAYKYCVKR